jgi:hypothetical protein
MISVATATVTTARNDLVRIEALGLGFASAKPASVGPRCNGW